MDSKGCNDGYTPNKAKRRPGGGNPSPGNYSGEMKGGGNYNNYPGATMNSHHSDMQTHGNLHRRMNKPRGG